MIERIFVIEKQYRTSTYRTISSNSRRGLLVLYSLLEKPDIFQARVCYSSQRSVERRWLPDVGWSEIGIPDDRRRIQKSSLGITGSG